MPIKTKRKRQSVYRQKHQCIPCVQRFHRGVGNYCCQECCDLAERLAAMHYEDRQIQVPPAYRAEREHTIAHLREMVSRHVEPPSG